MNSATPMNTGLQIVEKERTHRRIFLHAVPGTGTGCTLVTQPRRARNRHARIWGHPTRLPAGRRSQFASAADPLQGFSTKPGHGRPLWNQSASLAFATLSTA